MASLVRLVNTSQFSPASPDPCGIVYINHLNSLLISDSEVEEKTGAVFTGKNLFGVSLSGTLQSTLTTIGFSNEPTGVAYNPTNKHLYFSDDDKLKIFDLNPGTDGQYNTADDSLTSFSVLSFNGSRTDAEDVAYDITSGNLFIIDGFNSQVYETTTSGTLIRQFDTQSLGVLDPEGIAIGPNGNLFVVGNPRTNGNFVAEITRGGSLVQKIDISAANPVKPAGLTFAPSSQNPNAVSLYLVDRGVDNAENSAENDGRMYEFSFTTTPPPLSGVLAFSTSTFSINEDGTAVTSVQVTRTGGSNGAVSTILSLTNGTATAPSDYNNSPITVSFANGDSVTKTITIPIINDTLIEGNETINLSLGNPTNGATLGSQNTAVLTIVDNDTATSLATLNYISTSSSGSVGGVSFTDEDILSYNESTSTWSKYFKGANVGLGGATNVRDFHINADGSILLSVNQATTLAGVGSITDTDIVKFSFTSPTTTGEATAGSFELYFKGSNVGLDTSSEDLDSIAIAPDGQLILSTKGSFAAGGLRATNKDLLAFSPTSLGANTAGSWSLYVKGSNVGLTDSTENIDAAWVDDSGKISISTQGAYSVPSGSTSSLSGGGSDLLTFSPSRLGASTSGSFTASWSAAGSGLSASIGVDGFSRRFV